MVSFLSLAESAVAVSFLHLFAIYVDVFGQDVSTAFL